MFERTGRKGTGADLGKGDPLMGFCPYLRQAHRSEESLSAGTWHTTFFC